MSASGSTASSRPRGERRLADHDDAVPTGWPTMPRSVASTCRPARTPRWANGRSRPTRAWPSRRPSMPRVAEASPRGALAARRVLAQLPGALPRDQRHAQADAADVGCGRRDDRRATTRRALSTTSTRASRTTRYWHGLFGGIYISHMRLATYEHLIAAEDLAETDAGRLHEAERLDLDLDGHDEVRLSGPGQVVSIDLAEGAGIGGWDIRPVRHNVCSVMRRRPEAYHQKLRDHVESEGSAEPAPDATDAPTSIHEIFLVKEPGLAAMLHYDPYERRSGLVRFLAPGTTADAWATAEAVELGDAVEGAYEIEKLGLDRLVARRDASVSIGADGESAAVRVVKTFTLGGDRRSPTADREGRGHQPVGVDGRGAPRARVDGHDARWRRQPRGLAGESMARGRPTTPTGRRPARPACRRAMTPSASRSRRRSRRRPMSGARRSRRSRIPRPASSASTRAPACS